MMTEMKIYIDGMHLPIFNIGFAWFTIKEEKSGELCNHRFADLDPVRNSKEMKEQYYCNQITKALEIATLIHIGYDSKDWSYEGNWDEAANEIAEEILERSKKAVGGRGSCSPIARYHVSKINNCFWNKKGETDNA